MAQRYLHYIEAILLMPEYPYNAVANLCYRKYNAVIMYPAFVLL